MNRVKHIEIDLNTFRIVLRFQNTKKPLILHFDTPSRKFYLSLITLIFHEMKQHHHSGYVHIRKHEKRLKFLDDVLAGPNASGTIDGMWEKIRKAWHYSLPKLGEAAHFKIEGRDLVPPYEKGGKFLYDCNEDECDAWASLFAIDDITNKWRFRFAFDSVGLGLNDVTLTFGDLQNYSAWDAFLKHLENASANSFSGSDGEPEKISMRTHPIRWGLFAAVVGGIIILAATGVVVLNRCLRPAPPSVEAVAAQKPSIAILPFVNVSDDTDKDYFCDGITEELTNSLARVKDLRVISRTSAFYFKNKGFDLRTIGEKLNVDHILEGSMRVSGNNLRISAQLIKVADDSHLWADTYDREMKDIFNTQENLAQEITCSLKSKLGCQGEEVLKKRYTENIEAYNLYLRGRYLSAKAQYSEAAENFTQAVALDPNYALAYSGLADAYNYLAFFFTRSVQAYHQKAREAALKAIEIDDTLAEPYASLGFIKCRYEWDWIGAEKDLKKAIDLNPGDVLSHRYYSSFLRAVGRLDESLLEIKKALELDPLSVGVNARLGLILQFQGKAEEAVEQFQKTLDMYPDHPILLVWIGSALVDKGKYDEGIALITKAVKITKRKIPMSLGVLGYAYGRFGKIAEARQILNEAMQRVEKGFFAPTFIALIYTGLGDKDSAFEWLERAYEQKDPRLYPIQTTLNWKSLFSDPRWSKLMRKMGLPESKQRAHSM